MADQLTDKLTENLRSWRYVIARCRSIVLWEPPHQPIYVAAIVSFIFLLIFYPGASVLTTISLIGIVISLLDYLVPYVTDNYIANQIQWTPKLETEYRQSVQSLVATWILIRSLAEKLQEYKETNPKLYFIGLFTCLSFGALIGNLINNIILFYLLTLALAYYPGLKKHGYIDSWLQDLQKYLQSKFGDKKKR